MNRFKANAIVIMVVMATAGMIGIFQTITPEGSTMVCDGDKTDKPPKRAMLINNRCLATSK